MMIKIAGTSGSGKTSLMRAYMQMLGSFEEFRADYLEISKPPIEYRTVLHNCGKLNRIVVLGRYAKNVSKGGMDTISNVEIRYAMIENYAKQRNTLCLWEGLISGKTFGAVGALSNVTRTDYNSCISVEQRARSEGHFTYWVNYRQSPAQQARVLHAKILEIVNG